MLVANEFAKHNPKIRKLFDLDPTENKLLAARDFLELVRSSDVKKVVASGFIDRLLDGDMTEMVRQIEITKVG